MRCHWIISGNMIDIYQKESKRVRNKNKERRRAGGREEKRGEEREGRQGEARGRKGSGEIRASIALQLDTEI